MSFADETIKHILESVSSGLLLTPFLCFLPFLAFCFQRIALLHTTYGLNDFLLLQFMPLQDNVLVP